MAGPFQANVDIFSEVISVSSLPIRRASADALSLIARITVRQNDWLE
jgi:hypothetical protein